VTCAQRVHRAPWEPRSDNDTQNHAKPSGPVHLAASDAFDPTWNAKYEPRITGDFTGTTDEIIQWAACKWGIADNMVRAQAVVETHWHMDMEGDKEPRFAGHCAPGDDRDPCPTSFGILQIKWYFHPSKSPAGNAYPMSKDMTAFSLDYALAELRGCYDGHAWVGKKATGDLMGCIGLWYSGEWRDDNALKYIGWVQRELDSKPWLYW
jgi:autotransporter family porin